MQAFRQRALRKTSENAELEDTDPATGETIDYAELFAPGPDALWDLPYGVEIWESQPGDINQILSAVKDDLRDLGAVTRTPMSVLTPDSANQSAEGAAFAKEGLVFKSGDRINRATPGWDISVDLGLRLDGLTGPVVTQWLPAERQSLAEKADAAQKLSAGAGGTPIMSRRRVITDILGYGADIADQMEAELASETLTTALTSALTTPAAPAEPAAAPQTAQAGV